MNTLITSLWKVCLLRFGPQDLPGTRSLMIACLVLLGFSNFIAVSLGYPLEASFLFAVAGIGLTYAIIYFILWARGAVERLPQTLIALAGTGIMLNLLSLPLVWWQSQLEANQVSLSTLILNIFVIWNLAIVGHIFRHTFNIPFIAGCVAALFYFIVLLNLLRPLLGAV